MKKFMYIATALLVLVGCNKKGNSINGDEPRQIVRLSAKIEVPQNGNAHAPRKVVAVGDVSTIEEGGNVNFAWEEGDQVLLVNASGSSVFTLESGAGTNEGTFVGEALTDMSSYNVYYPAVAPEDNVVLTYNPDGTLRPMGSGEGDATNFLIDEYNSVIALQLIGQDKVSKIVYQAAGQPVDKITTTTLNFKTDDILTLSETTASAVIYLPMNTATDKGFSLTFYDENDKAYFEQNMSKDMSELGENQLLVFPTLDISRWVDMGPAGVWARYNVGTIAPEKSGDYFAWGEIEPYYTGLNADGTVKGWKEGKEEGYEWSSYSGFTSYASITEWTPAPYDASTWILKPEHDAATQHTDWGSDWCMPTEEDWETLFNTTNYTWEWCDGTNKKYFSTTGKGCLVTNKETGKSIFIPAADVLLNKSISTAGACIYWSPKLVNSMLMDGGGYPWAYCIVFGESPSYDMIEHPRYSGMPIRPIHKK